MHTSAFDGKTACEHADEAAAAIRAINHLTFHDTALPFPPDAYRLLGVLATMAARLPQAFEQVTRQLNRWHEDGLIGIDPGTSYAGDPDRAVRDAVTGLARAIRAAGHLSEALDLALHALTYAHYTGPTGGGEGA